MKCPYGPDAICSECDDISQVCHPEHGKRDMELEERIKKLEDTLQQFEERLFQLEEKERQRAREQYDREIRMDYDATKPRFNTEGC